MSKSLDEQFDSRTKNTSTGGSELVVLLAENQDRDRKHEEDERDQESEVEANVTFSEDHTKLTSQGTPVDEPVEPVVDTGGGDGRVDNDKLALAFLDTERVVGKLLHDEWRDIGLEGTSSETCDEQTENEDTEGCVRLVHYRGDRRDNEDGVTDFSDENRVEDGLVTTQILVGDPGTEQRNDIDPEGVEGGQRESDLLAQTEGTRLSVVTLGVEGSTGTGGSTLAIGIELALVDEVGIDDNGTIVGHALAQFDETDGENLQGNVLGNTAQGAHLLFGREVIAVGDVAFLESGLAL